jgi:phosphatidylinositol alpha-1,6-mannosyltransferase
MKTILVALEYPPLVGGVENYYENLALNWPEEFIVIDNSEHKLFNPKALFLKWFRAIRTIILAIKSSQADWLIVGEILPLGTAALIASYFINFKLAVFLHGLDFSRATRSSWKNFITRKILKRANLIICANSYTAKLVNDFLGSNNKIKIANPGVDSTKPIARADLINGLKTNYGLFDNFVFITICRLVERKGVASVLEVMPTILQENPNVRYIIIGAGPEEERLKKMITDPSLSGKVFLINNATDDYKWAWLEIANALVMPTLNLNGNYEGFGIVYLEANLFAKPVIATDNGGVHDAVIDNLNGLLIKPNDAKALEEAMLSLINDKELCLKLGEQGRIRAIKEFSWPIIVQKIYTFLKNAS